VNVASHDNANSEGKMAVIDLDAAETEAQVIWLSTLDLIPPDSVRRLHDVGCKREMKLRAVGLDKISALASCEDLVAASEQTGLGLKILETLHFQAVAHQKKTIIHLAPFNLDLERPMFLDIETNLGWNAVWLVGVLWDGNFRRFYADSWECERVMLLEFLDFLTQNTPSVLISYSCKNFDRRVLLKALRRHKLDESQRFGNIAHIDLGIVLKRCFALPIKERKVKSVGEYFRYPFKHRNLNGMQAVYEYQKHIQERRPLNPAVFEYNEDDVRVLAHIVEQLSNIGKGPPIRI
jgi:predicted RecB family nuclease